METNASLLKSMDPDLAAELEKDEDGSKKKEAIAKIPTLKEQIKELKNKVKTSEDNLKKDKDDADAKKALKDDQEALEKAEKILIVYESLGKKSYLPVMSFSNIAWTLGIFLVVGLILHFITKKLAKLFLGDRKE
jgi:hypothetical protein